MMSASIEMKSSESEAPLRGKEVKANKQECIARCLKKKGVVLSMKNDSIFRNSHDEIIALFSVFFLLASISQFLWWHNWSEILPGD